MYFRLNKFPYRLEFKYPFKLAIIERTGTNNLYLRLSYKNAVGWGEAVFPPYLDETVKTALLALKKVSFEKHSVETIFDLIARNQQILKEAPAAACAMEVCLLNWLADLEKKSLPELLNLKEIKKPTSYTIGICSDSEMKERIEATPEATYFKLKVSEEEIEEIIANYKACTDKPFVVDANQGFMSREKGLIWARKLEGMNVAYLEQPFHKDDFESHAWLKEQVNIPIIADESFQRVGDLEKVAQSFDGINVKIMKSGGVLEARAALYKAKGLGLKTILGCMSGSSVAINAAESLSSLADFVDLDGPYLIKNDPFELGLDKEWTKVKIQK